MNEHLPESHPLASARPEPSSDFVPSQRKGTHVPPIVRPDLSDPAPEKPLQDFVKLAGHSDAATDAALRSLRTSPAFAVGSHEQAIGRIERSPVNVKTLDESSTVAEFAEEQVIAARRKCLRNFAESFSDASAFVLDVNQKNGWWENPSRDKARNALDAMGAAQAAGLFRNLTEAQKEPIRDLVGVVIDKASEADRNDFEAFALIISEVAEAIESRRAGHAVPDDKVPEFSGIEAKLADTVIRIMDMSAARGWRVGEAIAAKLEVNAGRGHRHGGKLA